jgi:hypothetical protein
VRRVFGPRTAVEAVFLVAVPVVALVVGYQESTIIAASAVGYLLVLVVEVTLWREGAPLLEAIRSRRAARAAQKPTPAAAPVPGPAPVVPAPVVAAEPPPAPEPAPEPEPEVVPEPVVTRQPEHVRVFPAAPPPEPAAAERPPLVAVPELEPLPEPEPEPARLPEPAVAAVATVVPIGVGAGPQRWNVWDLERLTREQAGDDLERDEERTFLLMYLREFAGPDGLLPVDFDGLVRDSFGDLVGAR